MEIGRGKPTASDWQNEARRNAQVFDNQIDASVKMHRHTHAYAGDRIGTRRHTQVALLIPALVLNHPDSHPNSHKEGEGKGQGKVSKDARTHRRRHARQNHTNPKWKGGDLDGTDTIDKGCRSTEH